MVSDRGEPRANRLRIFTAIVPHVDMHFAQQRSDLAFATIRRLKVVDIEASSWWIGHASYRIIQTAGRENDRGKRCRSQSNVAIRQTVFPYNDIRPFSIFARHR